MRVSELAADHHEPLPDALLYLKQVYLAEAGNDIGILESCLEQAKTDAGQWPTIRARMREVAHNVAGQGTSFGYPLMTQVSQSLSYLLKSVHDLGPECLKLIEAHVQVMRTVLTMRIEGQGGEPGARLIHRLEDLVSRTA